VNRSAAIDGGDIAEEGRAHLERRPTVVPAARGRDSTMITGIKAMDAMNAIGRGQRQ